MVLIALNNLRDRESDILVNKKTLAVRFGVTFARAEIALGLYSPVIFIMLFYRDGHLSVLGTIASMSVCVLGGLAVLLPVYRIGDMRLINGLFPRTGMLSLVMASILSLFLLL